MRRALPFLFCMAALAGAPPPARVKEAFTHALPQMDGAHLRMQVLEVSYAPGGASAPHSHPFPVLVVVLEGALRTQVDGEPEHIYRAGECFYEAPNGVHRVSANASRTRRARFLACFLADKDAPLSTPIAQEEHP